jgi:hypothetical protein
MLGATLYINQQNDTRTSGTDRRLSHELAYDEAEQQVAEHQRASPHFSPGTSVGSMSDDGGDDVNVFLQFWRYGEQRS